VRPLAVVSAAVIVVMPAAPVLAGPRGTVCVVHLGAVPGLSPEAVRVAMTVEERKRAVEVRHVEARTPGDCGAGAGEPVVTLVVGGGSPLALIDASGAARTFDLSAVEPTERAQEAARRALAELRGPGAGETVHLVEPGARFPSPPQAPPTVPAPRSAGLRGYLSLAGMYSYALGPDLHAGGIEAEGGVAMFSERLAVGVAASWAPWRSGSAGGATWQATTGDVLAMLRGGLTAGAFLLRAGIGGGVEWRRVEVLPDTRIGSTTGTDVAAVVAGEVEALACVGTVFRVGLGVGVRGFIGGTSYLWQGDTVWEAPRIAVIAALRLGAAF